MERSSSSTGVRRICRSAVVGACACQLPPARPRPRPPPRRRRALLYGSTHVPWSGGGRLHVAFLRGGPRSRSQSRLAPSWISLSHAERHCSALLCCVRMLPLLTSLSSWLRCSIVQCYYTLNKWLDSGALRCSVWEEMPQVEKCLLYM
jgi:hypothetical protein